MQSGILTFTDQSETCECCGVDVTVNTVLDRDTSRYYWLCPECGAGNVEGA